jgi:hypothetical protein
MTGRPGRKVGSQRKLETRPKASQESDADEGRKLSWKAELDDGSPVQIGESIRKAKLNG